MMSVRVSFDECEVSCDERGASCDVCEAEL